MAKIAYGKVVFKDSTGQEIQIPGFSENDINKLKENIAKVTALEGKVNSLNNGQFTIAYKDFYTDETHKAEMEVGTFYLVPFNTQGQFLEFDPDTGKPKNPQTNGGVTDLNVAYYEQVFKNSSDTVNKLGKQEVQMSFADMAKLSANQTFAGDNTFSKDITVTASQDVDGLADTKVATAKFVRDVTDKKILDAGHIKGKYSATDPGSSIAANEMIFFPATDLLS